MDVELGGVGSQEGVGEGPRVGSPGGRGLCLGVGGRMDSYQRRLTHRGSTVNVSTPTSLGKDLLNQLVGSSGVGPHRPSPPMSSVSGSVRSGRFHEGSGDGEVGLRRRNPVWSTGVTGRETRYLRSVPPPSFDGRPTHRSAVRRKSGHV